MKTQILFLLSILFLSSLIQSSSFLEQDDDQPFGYDIQCYVVYYIKNMPTIEENLNKILTEAAHKLSKDNVSLFYYEVQEETKTFDQKIKMLSYDKEISELPYDRKTVTSEDVYKFGLQECEKIRNRK